MEKGLNQEDNPTSLLINIRLNRIKENTREGCVDTMLLYAEYIIVMHMDKHLDQGNRKVEKTKW